MAYSTLEDIRASPPEGIIIQLTDDEDLNPAVIDESDADHADMVTRINEAIEAADAEINGYCATRYTVPFVTVPGVVNKLSVELAIYYLYCRRSVPESIERRYEKAVSRLKDIANGKFTLGVDPAPTGSVAADAAETNKRANDRVFTRDALKGF
jgi:phage gp36-like protein